jgi:hypothetical protein
VKFEFKPEDFGRAGNPRGEIKELILTSTQAAELANTRLAEMLKDAPTVFGHIGTHERLFKKRENPKRGKSYRLRNS